MYSISLCEESGMNPNVLKKIFPKRNNDTNKNGLFIFSGPCVVENYDVTMQIAETLANIQDVTGVDIAFKASFVKANRTSINSFTGLPLEESLQILDTVKKQFNFKILSDVHEYTDFNEVGEVVDIFQTPAFLVRQTEFLRRVAAAGKPINIKKGQFLSPQEMIAVVNKVKSFGNHDLLVCERGTSFGYNYLINDFRGIQELLTLDEPLVFDATHSVQRPGALGGASGGDSQYAPKLAKAALAVGANGIFMETHPNPSVALSDGPNMIPLADMLELVKDLKDIHALINKL